MYFWGRYLIERKDYGNITIPASNGHYNIFEFPLCDLSKTFKLGGQIMKTIKGIGIKSRNFDKFKKVTTH